MEITVNKALQQGIAAHQAGKLQDAEKLYRAILQSQPAHPDANHNLGVLALSSDRIEQALPFLKLALELNPKQVQYWVSYIDTLIKLGQTDKAKQLLEEGQVYGLSGQKAHQLELRLGARSNTCVANFANYIFKVN